MSTGPFLDTTQAAHRRRKNNPEKAVQKIAADLKFRNQLPAQAVEIKIAVVGTGVPTTAEPF